MFLFEVLIAGSNVGFSLHFKVPSRLHQRQISWYTGQIHWQDFDSAILKRQETGFVTAHGTFRKGCSVGGLQTCQPGCIHGAVKSTGKNEADSHT